MGGRVTTRRVNLVTKHDKTECLTCDIIGVGFNSPLRFDVASHCTADQTGDERVAPAPSTKAIICDMTIKSVQ